MRRTHPKKWLLWSLVIIFLFTCIPVQAGEEGVVTGSVVNIRKGPGTSYGVVAKTEAGQQFSVLEKSGNWLRVRLHNGTEGWIIRDYVSVMTVLKKVIVTGTSVNVRKGPGTSYAKIGKVQKGQSLSVLEAKNDWYRVLVPGLGQAWIAAWLTREDTTPSSAAPPPSSGTGSTGYIIVGVNVLNVRSGPGTNYSIVTKIGLNEKRAVVAQQGGWYKIQVGDLQGWVSGEYVRPTDSPPPAGSGDTSSRGPIQESEVLIAPIAAGKTFKIIDSAGRSILKLEGWANNEYRTRMKDSNTLVLELNGRTERNYQGKISRLGISAVKIYPQADKCIIELTFTYALTHSIVYDQASKVTRIQVGAAQTQGLSGKVIVVDPGHASIQPGGWLDPGAIGPRTGIKEKDINLNIALKLKSLLEQAGARVIMTHMGQTELTLAGRAWLANNNNADIYVSIHANFNVGNKISGHTTYYYAPTSDPVLNAQRYSRQKLASLVQRELVKAAGRNDMGVLQERFAVLRETRVPSILVETAFLSDPTEENLLGTDAFRQKVATGIFNGIKAYFQ